MKITAEPYQLAYLHPLFAAVRHALPHRQGDLDDVIDKSLDNGIEITIEPKPRFHTTRQRGYYHKWKNEFARFTGNTPDEMHEALLMEAYGSELVETKMGEFRRPMQRSSTAGVTDYSLLIETLIRVAAQMGFHVPPPAPRRMEDFHARPADSAVAADA